MQADCKRSVEDACNLLAYHPPAKSQSMPESSVAEESISGSVLLSSAECSCVIPSNACRENTARGLDISIACIHRNNPCVVESFHRSTSLSAVVTSVAG